MSVRIDIAIKIELLVDEPQSPLTRIIAIGESVFRRNGMIDADLTTWQHENGFVDIDRVFEFVSSYITSIDKSHEILFMNNRIFRLFT